MIVKITTDYIELQQLLKLTDWISTVPYSGAVTGAAVLALTVEAGGIDSLEIKLQKESEGDAEGIVFNPDSLRKTCGIGVNLLVGGILRVAVGVTSLGGDDAADLLKVMLGTPEAASCKIYFLCRHYRLKFTVVS